LADDLLKVRYAILEDEEEATPELENFDSC
jgi:hypothetical protein